MSERQQGDDIGQILAEVDKVLSELSACLPRMGESPPPLLDIPKSHIRRIAFLCATEASDQMDRLIRILASACPTLPQKPLCLKTVFCEKVAPNADLKEILGRVKDAKAVAAIGLLGGLPPGMGWNMRRMFEAAGICFRFVEPGRIEDRGMLSEILFDMMLLKP